MTVGSTRERFSCLATAPRPAVRPLTAPSALLLENACGLANSSAQVQEIVLMSFGELVNFFPFLVLKNVNQDHQLSFVHFDFKNFYVSLKKTSAL